MALERILAVDGTEKKLRQRQWQLTDHFLVSRHFRRRHGSPSDRRKRVALCQSDYRLVRTKPTSRIALQNVMSMSKGGPLAAEWTAAAAESDSTKTLTGDTVWIRS